MHETPPCTGRSAQVGGRHRPRATSELPIPTLLEWHALLLTVYQLFLGGGRCYVSRPGCESFPNISVSEAGWVSLYCFRNFPFRWRSKARDAQCGPLREFHLPACGESSSNPSLLTPHRTHLRVLMAAAGPPWALPARSAGPTWSGWLWRCGSIPARNTEKVDFRELVGW